MNVWKQLESVPRRVKEKRSRYKKLDSEQRTRSGKQEKTRESRDRWGHTGRRAAANSIKAKGKGDGPV